MSPLLVAIFLVLYCALAQTGPARSSPKNHFISPQSPAANSQAYLEATNISRFTIHASNLSSCRFKSAVIPCECFMHISQNYTLEENDRVIGNFSVGPPNVKISVPTQHEMLNELTVHIQPKLCRSDRSTIKLEYRPYHVFPSDERLWTQVTALDKSLKNTPTSIVFACRHFADPGYYRISVTFSLVNYTLNADNWIAVNRTSQNSLRLRKDSIFPHCTSDFTVSWTIAQCRLESLHYRLRVLALPEKAKNHDDDAVYIEELAVTAEENSLQISCSQFDIIYEKYCFELVSVNKNSSISHTWYSTCVSTEPVERNSGGWSAWTDWSPCSDTCGTGTQRRVRFCDEPVPKRAKYCDGPLIETRECVLAKCPEAMMMTLLPTNCSCGCWLTERASTFFASSSHSRACDGNQTWSLAAVSGTKVADFNVKKQGNALGKLFVFLRAPYEELVWASDSNQEMQFSLPTSLPIHIVLWNKDNSTLLNHINNGFTISYSIRSVESQPAVASIESCQPFCPETLAIVFMAVIFIGVIFIPPIICASVTASLRRNESPELPLIENKYDSEMMRSGNTECTHVSTKNFVAKRSIGIQLSVQSTPRTGRACISSESPVPPRGQSSLSECEELEYDYYDGTTIPGSMLAPVHVMHSQIDIDQIIRQSELFINNVEKQDVHTQI